MLLQGQGHTETGRQRVGIPTGPASTKPESSKEAGAPGAPVDRGLSQQEGGS